jgi:hypothetical protein
MRLDSESCQLCELSAGSKGLARITILWYKLCWHLKNEGLRATVATLFRRLAQAARSLRRAPRAASARMEPGKLEAPPFEPVVSAKASTAMPLNLQPGELVEVKSAEEIQQTLDAGGKTRGLDFMAEMRPYLGKQFRVRKRVELIRLENTLPMQVRKVSHTVILEGAICEGSGVGCDRCCHFMWREAWLKRV